MAVLIKCVWNKKHVLAIMYLAVALAFPNWLDGIERAEQCWISKGKDSRSELTAKAVDYIVKNTDEEDKISVWGKWN